MAMRTCLITITCLGQRRRIVRAAAGACEAVLWALETYPQACRISARVIGPAEVTEVPHAQL